VALVGLSALGEIAAAARPLPSPVSASALSTPSADATDSSGRRCLVRLHGKGGAGAETSIDGDGVTTILPSGNADGWGGRQWVYFPDREYDIALQIVADAVADCEAVIVDGFSNGASLAAKMYCRGEAFDGRLLRVVVDDPVPDAGVADCTPDPDVELVLYWTGGLAATARPGWDCSAGDWTCEGGTTIGIEAYAAALGTDIRDSPFDDHEWYWDAPELSQWTPTEADARPLRPCCGTASRSWSGRHHRRAA
jgi:hypothetical protein